MEMNKFKLLVILALLGNIGFCVYEKNWSEGMAWACAFMFYINCVFLKNKDDL